MDAVFRLGFDSLVRQAPGRIPELFGPLSLLALVGLWPWVWWLASLCFNGRAAPDQRPQKAPGFLSDLYLSGTTFFTLGLGDVTPRTTVARALIVIEAARGLRFSP